MCDYKMPSRPQDSNKGTFGKILNIAGSKNYIGAAYLSTKSALKLGAGYVALATTPEIIKIVSTIIPEAIFYKYNEFFKHINEFNVILIGCGIGTSIQAQSIFKKIIINFKNSNIPVVIDADGLNILAKMNNVKLPHNTIITPHPMEAARLLGVPIEYILNNQEQCTKKLSLKYKCVTVLKSHRTIICDNDGKNMFINKHGNSALAKAGTGDVLAGIIASMLAQKMSPFEACKLGVYIHSRTGEIASQSLTEYCVLASDLFDFIPKTISELS